MPIVKMEYKPTIKTVLKTFIFPFIAATLIGILSTGIDNITANIVTASLAVGFECMITIHIYNAFMIPVYGLNSIILYAVAGSVSGITWWEIIRPEFSFIIPLIIGAVLAGLWAYTEKGLINI